MSDGVGVVVAIIGGYLIGTFPTAAVVTRLVTRGRVDIRQTGSGNPGGLNAMRVIGKGWGLLVIVLDTAKGALAGLIGLGIADPAAYAAGIAVIAGHCWPVWTRFRGGKGVAAAGGSFASVFPPYFAIGGTIALVSSLVTRRTGLSMAIACSGWVAAGIVWWAADLDNWWGPEPSVGLVIYSVLGSAMILGRFRAAPRRGFG
ncbi:MAG TPA: glycerol-3-phosphate acyltransferase [Acidimicrobiia bacterium]